MAKVQSATSSLKRLNNALQNVSSNLQSNEDRFTQAEMCGMSGAANIASQATQLAMQPIYTLATALSQTGGGILQSSVLEMGKALAKLNQIDLPCSCGYHARLVFVLSGNVMLERFHRSRRSRLGRFDPINRILPNPASKPVCASRQG
jgi:hypothetical protein